MYNDLVTTLEMPDFVRKALVIAKVATIRRKKRYILMFTVESWRRFLNSIYVFFTILIMYSKPDMTGILKA
jgi:hypothetical protein